MNRYMGPSNIPPGPIITKGGKRKSMRKTARKNRRNKSRRQHKRR